MKVECYFFLKWGFIIQRLAFSPSCNRPIRLSVMLFSFFFFFSKNVNFSGTKECSTPLFFTFLPWESLKCSLYRLRHASRHRKLKSFKNWVFEKIVHAQNFPFCSNYNISSIFVCNSKGKKEAIEQSLALRFSQTNQRNQPFFQKKTKIYFIRTCCSVLTFVEKQAWENSLC